MLIDTHAHLNFNAYQNDLDEVIRRSLDNDVWMLNVGSQYETSKKAVEIAENYQEGVWAAVGLHPIHVNEEGFYYEKYKDLAKSKKMVAIGETGLDYYYRPKSKTKLEQFKNKQKEAFLKHLELAKELKLPIIFHCRVAHDDLLDILNQQLAISNQQLRGVIHCFTGTWEQAKKYLEMGFYLGFNGIIFKLNLDEVIKKTPLEKILVETDCPYLTPVPMEGRNEPIYVKYVAQKISEIKNISFDKVAEITTQNAKKLFKI